jgi:hypothetical protein
MVAAFVGCGGSGSPLPAATPTPQQHGGDLAAIRVDEVIVRRKGYEPATRVAQTADGFGGTLYAFHGTCQGSADGYCQIMLFFDGTRFVGTDTTNPSTAITGYEAAGAGRIAVTYAHYAKTDPLCCPSLAPVTVTYQWNGSRIKP